MVKMEKYCPNCHKTYNNMKSKFCTNCATELISREKRKPIPPELKHKILVRDGYRCRECGKSKKETSLEIDHIYPLSKGGTTTEDNLWVLCRECNQAKKDDVWKDDEIEITKNELSNLKNQLKDAKKGLKTATDKDQIRDYKFKIKKLNTEYIPNVTNKLKKLTQEEKKKNAEMKSQQIENKRREDLFKDLYIELDGDILIGVCDYFQLTESSTEDNLRLLVSKHNKNEIYKIINKIKLEEKVRKKAEEERIKKEEEKRRKAEEERIKKEEEKRRKAEEEKKEKIRKEKLRKKAIARVEKILTLSEIKQLSKDFSLNEYEFYEMLYGMNNAQLHSLKTWLNRKYPNGFW